MIDLGREIRGYSSPVAGMRIDSIELRHLRLPLVHPFQTSFQRETVKDTVIVRVRTADGEGWGEAPVHAAPRFSGESVETVWVTARDWLAPPLLGMELDDSTDLGALWPRIRGNPIARSGLEQALWCLRASDAGQSLAAVYARDGEPPAERIGVGVSIGIQPALGALLDRVREHVELGYQRVKIKIQPGWDAEPLAAIRQEFPDLVLGADANGAYSTDAHDELRALDRFGLLFLEQPLRPHLVYAHKLLQAQLDTTICLDESLDSPDRVAEALGMQACRMVNIKIGRIGGPTAARAARDLCRDSRTVPCWVGGMLESGIGRLHNVAMAATPGFTHPGDISASKRYVEEDVIEPAVEVAPDGTVAVPTTPGLGAAVREDLLERYTVRVLDLR